MTRILLRGESIGSEEILSKEHAIRRSINYENEVATMFEFIMFYIKIWKVACQDKLMLTNGYHLEQVYVFLSEIEAATYDFTKSVLIDCDSMRFKPSVIVCGLICLTIKLNFLLNFSRDRMKKQPFAPEYVKQINICSEIWDNLVKKIFGHNSLSYMDQFGEYLFLR